MLESKKYEDFYNEASQYRNILIEYKKTSQQFFDNNFHPTNQVKESKIYISDSMENWSRIDDIYDAPLFQDNLIHPDYIQQGELGDCYLLASFSRVAERSYIIPSLFETSIPNRILGSVHDSLNIKSGAVVIYFNCFGKKTPVLIDTLMPIKNGKLRFSKPSDKNFSPWFCLIEKAYAKLYGSYSNIISGTLPHAMYNMFGYYPKNKIFSRLRNNSEKFFSDQQIFEKMLKYQQKGAVMATSITYSDLQKGVTKEEVESKGLVAGHCYLIVKAQMALNKKFVCLRNPWGGHEWNGDWSDDSPLWTPELEKALNVVKAEDGTFWMIDKDFFRYFTDLEVSKPFAENIYSKRFFCQLLPGDHDGINPNDKRANLGLKNNFAFKVTEPIDKGKKCRFHIVVERHHELFDKKRNMVFNPPSYCVYLVRNKGKKIDYNELCYCNRKMFVSSSNLFSVSYELDGNDDVVTIVLHRLQKCNLVEDCYILIFCDHKFTLYDIDHPDKKIEYEETPKIVFDISSSRFNKDKHHIINKSNLSNTQSDVDAISVKNDFNSKEEKNKQIFENNYKNDQTKTKTKCDDNIKRKYRNHGFNNDNDDTKNKIINNDNIRNKHRNYDDDNKNKTLNEDNIRIKQKNYNDNDNKTLNDDSVRIKQKNYNDNDSKNKILNDDNIRIKPKNYNDNDNKTLNDDNIRIKQKNYNDNNGTMNKIKNQIKNDNNKDKIQKDIKSKPIDFFNYDEYFSYSDKEEEFVQKSKFNVFNSKKDDGFKSKHIEELEAKNLEIKKMNEKMKAEIKARKKAEEEVRNAHSEIEYLKALLKKAHKQIRDNEIEKANNDKKQQELNKKMNEINQMKKEIEEEKRMINIEKQRIQFEKDKHHHHHHQKNIEIQKDEDSYSSNRKRRIQSPNQTNELINTQTNDFNRHQFNKENSVELNDASFNRRKLNQSSSINCESSTRNKMKENDPRKSQKNKEEVDSHESRMKSPNSNSSVYQTNKQRQTNNLNRRPFNRENNYLNETFQSQKRRQSPSSKSRLFPNSYLNLKVTSKIPSPYGNKSNLKTSGNKSKGRSKSAPKKINF